MVTEILSALISFVAWCFVVIRRHSASDPTADIIADLFFLLSPFFISVIGFLIIFYRKMVHFIKENHSVANRGLLSAEIVLLAAGALSVVLTTFFGTPRSSQVVIGFTLLAMALSLSLHLIAAYFLHKWYNHPRNKLNVLVLGMNYRTVQFCQIINKTSHIGAEVCGYLDERKVDDAPSTYLSTLDDLDTVLKARVIDMVSIFLPIRSFYDTIGDIIKTCGFYGVTSYLVGNVFEAHDGIRRVQTSINDFGNMAYSATSADYVGLVMKRVFDVVAALGGLVILSPILLGIAAFIKLTSKGPVLFKQERIGLNKRSFEMLKFRTMVPDAEKMLDKIAALNEMDGAAFKITNDPRLIPGGAFLRRHGLDELPQLWSVVRGDMSLVGPRPLSRRDFDLLEEDWQRKRFSMRPGLTCTWQISDNRNEIPFMQWMQMDLDYIAHWKFRWDFVLLLKTVKAVIVGTGK
ncbi:MAG: exopolysaccharide biosynthesis polyprenyl glycosylphosphotransferase [Planctomycetes bacterium]|nr:exopolysaccharide biosynthesis polyprenyl glycosylphosphotransferase [Planctomycetota bacterium]